MFVFDSQIPPYGIWRLGPGTSWSCLSEDCRSPEKDGDDDGDISGDCDGDSDGDSDGDCYGDSA